MAVQPFTFSISNGIYIGLAFSAMLWVFSGDFLDTFRGWGRQLRSAAHPPTGDNPSQHLESLLDHGHGASVHSGTAGRAGSSGNVLPNYVRYSEPMGSPTVHATTGSPTMHTTLTHHVDNLDA
eukprot:364208-Chlamydomonas_euryale.AAC.9